MVITPNKRNKDLHKHVCMCIAQPTNSVVFTYVVLKFKRLPYRIYMVRLGVCSANGHPEYGVPIKKKHVSDRTLYW